MSARLPSSVIHRLIVPLCIMIALTSACGVKLPSQINLPTEITGGEPRTLDAATKAAQERENRFRSGDYAGAWLLSAKQMQNAISQTDYVTLEQTCASALTRLPATVTGVRMDGNDRAIVREEVMSFKDSFTMVYEDGKWLRVPDDFWIQNAGKPVQQLIAEQRTAGKCGDQSTTNTATTTPTSAAPATTTTRLPADGSLAFPGTRYALPGAYSSYAPAQERPEKLDFEYKYHSLRNLEWASWGPDGAQGTGAEWVQLGCDPSCASGPSYSNPIQIRAANPQPPPSNSLCPQNVLFYTDVIISYPTTVPPHDVAIGGFAVSDLQWTTDNGLTAAHYTARKPYCGS